MAIVYEWWISFALGFEWRIICYCLLGGENPYAGKNITFESPGKFKTQIPVYFESLPIGWKRPTGHRNAESEKNSLDVVSEDHQYTTMGCICSKTEVQEIYIPWTCRRCAFAMYVRSCLRNPILSFPAPVAMPVYVYQSSVNRAVAYHITTTNKMRLYKMLTLILFLFTSKS